MACGSGCCDLPKAAEKPKSETSSIDNCCGDDCCSSDEPVNDATPERSSENDCDDELRHDVSCCQSAKRQNSVSKSRCCEEDLDSPQIDTCCSPKLTTKITCDDGCCASGEGRLSGGSPTPQQSSQEGCYSKSVEQISVSSQDPLCCAEKPLPCCDDSCIERLALRECRSVQSTFSSDDRGKSKPTALTNCQQGKDGKACPTHTRTTIERYKSKLDAFGCICRSLVAFGQDSCCAQQRVSAKIDETPRNSRSNLPSTSCCTSRDINCGSTTNVSIQLSSSCADGCCGGSESKDAIETIEVTPEGRAPIDLEKGIMGTDHIILSVSGMTCTGCETKLKRTLGTLDSISNLKTSLVLARAEFDLNSRMSCANDIIKHLERTTEFKCEQVTNHGSSLDLLYFDPLSFVKGDWPDGVTDMRVLDKTTVRVEYDAKIVGARDLVEKCWKDPLQLAPARPDPTLHAGSKHVRHMGLMTLLSIILTVPVLVLAWAPLPQKEIAYGSASLALATIVQVVIAGPFYPKAIKDLIFSRTVEVDLLIVMSTSAAYIFSVISFGYMVANKPLPTGQFFETSTLLVTIIMIGRFISALARQKAAESISIRSLQTSTAILMGEDGTEKEIDARLLQYGDTFKVSPDCRIPTDGTVISGSSEVDESTLTGESIPVEKHPKSTLIAGSINGSGILVVRLTRLPGDNTISTIASMVDEAKLSKPKIQDIADHVASYFVPVVVALTIVVFVIWIAIGTTVRNQSGTEATVQALTYAITVLIVSCPCAIGLAVPMVVVIASGVAAQRGVIFKSANSIEIAHKTTDVVFDKTGTLTQGELVVSREKYLAIDVNETKSLLLGLLGSIKHPVSAAVVAHLKSAGVSASTVEDSKSLAGKGVEGSFAGRSLRAGNSRWLGTSSHPDVRAILSERLTTFCFSIDGSLAAVYGLQDSLRSDAQPTISALHDAGISVHILSGDDDEAVGCIAAQLEVPEKYTYSRCSPADKQAYIQKLLQVQHTADISSKLKKPVVIFVGDGTNDAVALAQATIGVHISTGTDVAKSAADVVLVRPNLSGVLTIVAISKKAYHRIVFNFTWSFIYNLFAVLLGAGAFVHARIPPEFAGLGELVSVLPVIAIAVALRWAKV